jgi:hypothetical protein
MPLILLAQDRHSSKFAVPYEKHNRLSGDQLTHLRQQSQVFVRTTVSSNMFDPGPGDGNGSFSIGQAYDQKLMPKADLGVIHDQSDFFQVPQLSFQPVSSHRLVPFLHSDGWIIQQPTQSPSVTQQLSWTRNLPCNAAQAHRPALKDTDHQPNKIANLSNAFSGSQFPNPANPGIIEVVRPFEDPPVKEFCEKNYFIRILSADQLFPLLKCQLASVFILYV